MSSCTSRTANLASRAKEDHSIAHTAWREIGFSWCTARLDACPRLRTPTESTAATRFSRLIAKHSHEDGWPGQHLPAPPLFCCSETMAAVMTSPAFTHLVKGLTRTVALLLGVTSMGAQVSCSSCQLQYTAKYVRTQIFAGVVGGDSPSAHCDCSLLYLGLVAAFRG